MYSHERDSFSGKVSWKKVGPLPRGPPKGRKLRSLCLFCEFPPPPSSKPNRLEPKSSPPFPPKTPFPASRSAPCLTASPCSRTHVHLDGRNWAGLNKPAGTWFFWLRPSPLFFRLSLVCLFPPPLCFPEPLTPLFSPRLF